MSSQIPSSLVINSVKSQVKSFASNIDEAGRRQIVKRLTEAADPYKSIQSLQQSFSLQFPRCQPAFSFLENLQTTSTAQIHQTLFDIMKGKLDHELEGLSEDKLLIMLQASIHFIRFKDLKSIPIDIIKRLPRVPESYLKYLSSNNYLHDLPVAVRRQAWEINTDLFVKTIESNCKEALQVISAGDSGALDRRSLDSQVKIICDYIGGSESLFSTFANHCCTMSLEQSTQRQMNSSQSARQHHYSWESLLRYVLMGVQCSEYKIASIGKLHDLAWLIDSCLRKSRIDANDISSFYKMISALMLSQASYLEKDYEKRVLSLGFTIEDLRNNDAHNEFSPYSFHVNNSNSNGDNFAKFPSTSSQRKKRGPAAVATTSNSIVGTSYLNAVQLKPILLSVWKYLTELDDQNIFAKAVSDDVAPGYSRMIRNPVDLSMIKRRINMGYYNSFQVICRDIKEMFDNCVTYNGVQSYFGDYAYTMEKEWKSKSKVYTKQIEKAEMRIRNGKSVTYNSDSDASFDGGNDGLHDDDDGDETEALVEKSLDQINKRQVGDYDSDIFGAGRMKFAGELLPQLPKPTSNSSSGSFKPEVHTKGVSPSNKLKRELKEFKDLYAVLTHGWKGLTNEDVSKLFASPVTESIAPGYHAVIKRPMDLSTIKTKIDKHYYNSLTEMDVDVRLMVNNAVVFNQEGSLVASVANKLLRYWNKLLPNLENAVKSLDNAEVVVSSGVGRIQNNKNKNSSVVEESGGEEEFDDNYPAKDSGNDANRTSLNIGTKRNRLQKNLVNNDSDEDNEAFAEEASTSDADRKARKKVRRILDDEDDGDEDIETTHGNSDTGHMDLPDSEKEIEEAVEAEAFRFVQGPSVTPFTREQCESWVAQSSAKSKQQQLDFFLDKSYFHLVDIDEYGYFAMPISDFVIPGYSKIIKLPMYLCYIRVKIDRRLYKSVAEFDADVKVMISNCNTFNEVDSPVTIEGNRLLSVWNDSFQSIQEVYESLPDDEQQISFSPMKASEASELNVTTSLSPSLEKNDQQISNQTREITFAGSAGHAAMTELFGSDDEDDKEASNNQIQKNILDIKSSGAHSKLQENTSESSLSALGHNPSLPDDSSSFPCISNILRSSRKAAFQIKSNGAATLKQLGQGAQYAEELPSILVETKLLWAVHMLRDTSLQGLLQGFLINSLQNLVNIRSVSIVDDTRSCLPKDSRMIVFGLQLCQLAALRSNAFPALDQLLLRHYLPLMLYNLLEIVLPSGDDTEEQNLYKRQTLSVQSLLSRVGLEKWNTGIDSDIVHLLQTISHQLIVRLNK